MVCILSLYHFPHVANSDLNARNLKIQTESSECPYLVELQNGHM